MDFPIKHGGSFHSYVNVYQRFKWWFLYHIITIIIIIIIIIPILILLYQYYTIMISWFCSSVLGAAHGAAAGLFEGPDDHPPVERATEREDRLPRDRAGARRPRTWWWLLGWRGGWGLGGGSDGDILHGRARKIGSVDCLDLDLKKMVIYIYIGDITEYFRFHLRFETYFLFLRMYIWLESMVTGF